MLLRPPSVPGRGANRFSTVSRGNSIVTIFMNRSRGGDFINECGGISLNFARSDNFGICNGEAGHKIHVVRLSRGGPNRCRACAHAFSRLINAGIGGPLCSCFSDGTPRAISTTVPVVRGTLTVVTTVITIVVLLTGFLWGGKTIVDRGGASGGGGPFIG